MVNAIGFRFLAVSLVFLLLVACGKDKAADPGLGTKSISQLGTFGESACFRNKLASEAFGQDVYTRASMEFRSNGTGTNSFELFLENDCSGAAAFAGWLAIEYVVTPLSSGVFALEIDQFDENDPGNNMRYWLMGVLLADGWVIDIDSAGGDSGPYFEKPSADDAAAFLAQMGQRGVLFRRQ
jgi:hypothetical protein